jgi:pimeloyl-ACP methyl ester carboxylesterase
VLCDGTAERAVAHARRALAGAAHVEADARSGRPLHVARAALALAGEPQEALRGLEQALDVSSARGSLMGQGIGQYPAAAVVTVDGAVAVAAFARRVSSLEPQLAPECFARTWGMFRESMHIDRVPAGARALLRAGDGATREQVLGYWVEFFERTPEELAAWVDEQLALARAAALPYLALRGGAMDPEERALLHDRLPQAEVVVWPVGHHFPHLADPARFAELLTSLAAGVPVS